MDEQEWFCEQCGVAYDSEAQVLECAWADQTYGIGADPRTDPRVTTAAA
jgi:hypothetical protein